MIFVPVEPGEVCFFADLEAGRIVSYNDRTDSFFFFLLQILRERTGEDGRDLQFSPRDSSCPSSRLSSRTS